VLVKDGKIVSTDGSAAPAQLQPVQHPVSVCDGRDGTWWVIGETDVTQIGKDGQVLRHLAAKAGDPLPVQIAASPVSDEIYLFEQNDRLQRVRGLALVSGSDVAAASSSPSASPQKTSVWKVVFAKSIVFSDKLEQVADLLKMLDGKPFVSQPKMTIYLKPNPLEQGKQAAVEINVSFDSKGSVIKAADGLPLCRVSEKAGLRWVAMARESDAKTITIFQSDGAAVEQFKIGRLGNMLSFDAGDFDFDPATVK
jgi:hypothetical protein